MTQIYQWLQLADNLSGVLSLIYPAREDDWLHVFNLVPGPGPWGILFDYGGGGRERVFSRLSGGETIPLSQTVVAI